MGGQDDSGSGPGYGRLGDDNDMSGMMWLTIVLILLTILGFLGTLLRKVTKIDTQINNGIADRLERVEERQYVLLVQVTDLHGWMNEIR